MMPLFIECKRALAVEPVIRGSINSLLVFSAQVQEVTGRIDDNGNRANTRRIVPRDLVEMVLYLLAFEATQAEGFDNRNAARAYVDATLPLLLRNRGQFFLPVCSVFAHELLHRR